MHKRLKRCAYCEKAIEERQDDSVKQAEKDKPIATTPKGVWEASRADEKKHRAGKTSPGTDLQQNGYPQKQS